RRGRGARPLQRQSQKLTHHVVKHPEERHPVTTLITLSRRGGTTSTAAKMTLIVDLLLAKTTGWKGWTGERDLQHLLGHTILMTTELQDTTELVYPR
ncbi:hypothetical protein QHH03_30535, partial [Aphanizomenon sp. 202]|nr:hypothetical protein [Aphanizomenon sp. 202]